MGFNIAVSIFLLNLLDGIFTLLWVAFYGYSIEANPLMRAVMIQAGDWWLIPKILFGLMAAIIVTVFWKKYKSARIASIIVFLAYLGVVIYHFVLMSC